MCLLVILVDGWDDCVLEVNEGVLSVGEGVVWVGEWCWCKWVDVVGVRVGCLMWLGVSWLVVFGGRENFLVVGS